MDQSLVAHYARKYATFDSDELGDLVARRADLADEAAAALDRVLSEKGLSESDVYTPPPTPAPRTEEEERENIAVETKLSRELWRGGLATACNIMLAVTFMSPVQLLLRRVSLGALWVGLLIFAAGFVGFRAGRAITRHICADAEVPIGEKKKRLWMFFATLWPVFFVVYIVSSALFGRG